MGFKKENGNWIKRGQDARTEFEEIPEDIPGPSTRPSEAGPSHPPPSPLPSTVSDKFSEEQLTQLRTLLAENDKSRSEEIQQLKDELKAFKEEVNSTLDYLTTSIGSSVWKFSEDLEKIFKRLDDVTDGSEKYKIAASELKKDINFAVNQICSSFDDLKKYQKDDFMEMIGHLKKIVYKHTR